MVLLVIRPADVEMLCVINASAVEQGKLCDHNQVIMVLLNLNPSFNKRPQEFMCNTVKPLCSFALAGQCGI